MPSNVAKLGADALVLLVKARWNEHLVEDVLLTCDEGISVHGFENMLVHNKLARAQLEVELYSSAIAKAQPCAQSSKLTGFQCIRI